LAVIVLNVLFSPLGPRLGSKSGEEIALLNGTATTTTSGTVFCTPSGVVIPSLVALPPSEVSASSSSGGSMPTNYELPRLPTSMSTHFKHSSTIPNSSAGNSKVQNDAQPGPPFPRLLMTIFFVRPFLLSVVCLGARSIEFTQRVAEGYR
jgi:hypothetical protein